jgi:nicotinamidase-related amidase
MRTRSHFPKASTALLLVDVINPCDFPGGHAFVRRNLAVARAIAKLAERARRHRVPVIYVNDNFGRWRSDIDALVAACARPDKPGAAIVNLLRPRSTDYVVLKTTLSGFYQTPLDTMLRLGGIRTVIVAGFSADDCVLFTAADAYMREYRIVVPRTCVGAKSGDAVRRALTSMRSVLDARTPAARRVRLPKSHL